MKRFKIKNLKEGLEYQVDAEVLKMQPEYGKPAHAEERLKTPGVYDEEGKEVSPPVYETVQVPAEHQIEEIDISAELAQKEALKLTLKALKDTKGKKRSADEINALLDYFCERFL